MAAAAGTEDGTPLAAEQQLPETWCGTERSTDDLANAVSPPTRPAVQAHLRVRVRPAEPLRAVRRPAAGQRLDPRPLPGRAVRRAQGAALGHGDLVRARVRRHPGPAAAEDARPVRAERRRRTSTARRRRRPRAAGHADRPRATGRSTPTTSSARTASPGPRGGASPTRRPRTAHDQGHLESRRVRPELAPRRLRLAERDAPRDRAQPRRRAGQRAAHARRTATATTATTSCATRTAATTSSPYVACAKIAGVVDETFDCNGDDYFNPPAGTPARTSRRTGTSSAPPTSGRARPSSRWPAGSTAAPSPRRTPTRPRRSTRPPPRPRAGARRRTPWRSPAPTRSRR